jgi:uncharacterized membrane protein YozB (DUF420 family)
MEAEEKPKSGRVNVGFLATMVVGVTLGVVLALIARELSPRIPPFFPSGLRVLQDINIVISTVAISILVALTWIHMGIWRRSKAEFALGLSVVFLALLAQSLLTFPLLLVGFGGPFGPLAPFFLAAEAFKVVALGVFLYLTTR